MKISSFGRKHLAMTLNVFGVISAGFVLWFFPWSIYPWIILSSWAAWRFSLRYLRKDCFECTRCRRLKCAKHIGSVDAENKKICATCEQKRALIAEAFDCMERSIKNIGEGVALKTGGRYPPISNK